MDTASSSNFISTVYFSYLGVSAGLTVVLARILSRHGRAFLSNAFKSSPELADSVNTLLVVGFYLVNFGYACLSMAGGNAATSQAALETFASKLGTLLLTLAAMHFANLYVFNRIRLRGEALDALRPPVPPQAVVSAWQPSPAPTAG